MPKKGVRTKTHFVSASASAPRVRSFVQTCLTCWYRLSPRPPPHPSRREATPSESTRFGPTLPSEDPRPLLSLASPSTPEPPFRRNQPGTSTPSSSTPWALRAPSRPLKTATHWCSSSTEEPTSPWSRRPAKSSTTSRSQESTPSSDPTASRRLTSWSLLSRTLSTSPTRSVLCERA